MVRPPTAPTLPGIATPSPARPDRSSGSSSTGGAMTV